MGGYEEYGLRSGLARKYRIGLNIVSTGKIRVKGLFLEYGEYSAEYSPTIRPYIRQHPLLSRYPGAEYSGSMYRGRIWLDCCGGWVVRVQCLGSVCRFVLLRDVIFDTDGCILEMSDTFVSR